MPDFLIYSLFCINFQANLYPFCIEFLRTNHFSHKTNLNGYCGKLQSKSRGENMETPACGAIPVLDKEDSITTKKMER